MNGQITGPAPDVTLKAIGHGRSLPLNKMGTTVLLAFVARETSDQPSQLAKSVRERYPHASQVTIISVADGRRFPKLVRKVAEQIMKSSYNDAVKNLLPRQDPEHYVLIAPDWDGAVYNALGVDDVTKQIAIAVINAQGDVVGSYQGNETAAEALALLERAGVLDDGQAHTD